MPFGQQVLKVPRSVLVVDEELAPVDLGQVIGWVFELLVFEAAEEKVAGLGRVFVEFSGFLCFRIRLGDFLDLV